MCTFFHCLNGVCILQNFNLDQVCFLVALTAGSSRWLVCNIYIHIDVLLDYPRASLITHYYPLITHCPTVNNNIQMWSCQLDICSFSVHWLFTIWHVCHMFVACLYWMFTIFLSHICIGCSLFFCHMFVLVVHYFSVACLYWLFTIWLSQVCIGCSLFFCHMFV